MLSTISSVANRVLSLIRPGRSSMENPSHPLDPWVESIAEASTADSALKIAAVWRAAGLIARTVAKLPVGVYRDLEPGSELDVWHAGNWLIRHRPNEHMTPYLFKELLQLHALLEGNGYAYIQRDGSGRPLELLPLDPRRTVPVRENKRLWYVHTLTSGESRKLAAEDVLHIRGMGFDGLMGYRVLEVAAQSLGLASAMQVYGTAYFRNSARPSVILTYPGRLSDPARKNLVSSWERMAKGLENAHRTAILEEGASVKELTINARDSQLIEGRQFSLVDVANWFHVPAHKLGSTVNTSYGSLEQENQSFLNDTIDPWLVNWEEELEAKLLTEAQRVRESHRVEFDRGAMLRADSSTRASYYSAALNSGWMSRDEVRLREGLNPIPGGQGAQYYTPAGMQPIAAAPGPVEDPAADPVPAEPTPPPPEASGPAPVEDPGQREAVQAATRAVLEAAVARAVKRVTFHARKRASKPAEFLSWLDSLEDDHLDVIAEAIGPAVWADAAARGVASLPTGKAMAEAILGGIRAELLEASGRYTAADLAAGIDWSCEQLEARPMDLIKGVYSA